MKRILLFVVPGLILLLSLPALAQSPTIPANTAKHVQSKPAQPGARHGYSIFRNTMVDMSWPEVKKAAESNAIVLLPVAVIEEHGPHLSLGADTYLVYQACKQLKQRLAAENIQAVIAPPVYWGVMQLEETGAYPGSFTVQPSTMKALLVDILTDLKRWGFRRVYPLNLHGDRVHGQTFQEAMAEGRAALGLDIFNFRTQTVVRPQFQAFKIEKPFAPDYHAGAPETAEMLKYFPEEVNVPLAKTLKPEGSFHPLGYMGDPANHGNANPILETGLVEPAVQNIKSWLKAAQPQ